MLLFLVLDNVLLISSNSDSVWPLNDYTDGQFNKAGIFGNSEHILVNYEKRQYIDKCKHTSKRAKNS